MRWVDAPFESNKSAALAAFDEAYERFTCNVAWEQDQQFRVLGCVV